MDAAFTRPGHQKAYELSFGGLQRRVGHVVDESDRQYAIGDVAVAVDLIGPPWLRRRQRGADDGPMSVEQERHGRCSFRRFKPRTSRAGGSKSLIDIFDDVADMFDADRKPDGFGQNAGHALLLGGHLAVSGGGRVTRKRLRVADVDEPRDQLQRIVEGLAGLKTALDAEGEQRRGVAVEIFLDQRVVRALGKAGIVDPFDARVTAQEVGDLAGVLDMALDAERQVSIPCSNKNALNGESTAPMVR